MLQIAPNRLRKNDYVALNADISSDLLIAVSETNGTILEKVPLFVNQDLLIADIAGVRIVREKAMQTQFARLSPKLDELLDNVVISYVIFPPIEPLLVYEEKFVIKFIPIRFI